MSKNKNDGLSRRDFLTTTAAGATAAALVPGTAHAQEADRDWHHTADFVSIGAGVSGLAAAVSALEHGASVLMVDENIDIGGHGMVSGGIVHLGGGHSVQQMHGIEDTNEMVYQDLIRPDHPLARYNDRDLVRAFADENYSTFEWLLENGVAFIPTTCSARRWHRPCRGRCARANGRTRMSSTRRCRRAPVPGSCGNSRRWRARMVRRYC